MNNKYKLKVRAPLLHPGLSIETECSEAHVVSVASQLIKMVSCINNAGEAGNGNKYIRTSDPKKYTNCDRDPDFNIRAPKVDND